VPYPETVKLRDGHLNDNWLSITALQAGITLGDNSLQSEVFVNIGTSHLKPNFPTMLRPKKQF